MVILLHLIFCVSIAVHVISSSFAHLVTSDHQRKSDQGTLMKFTFTDGDPFGPKNWAKTNNPGHGRNLASQKVSDLVKNVYEKNNCKRNWMSPININTKHVVAPELGKQSESGLGSSSSADDTVAETLIIAASDQGIQNEVWEFGHPMENYNGIEIRSLNLGIIQLMDHFDPIGRTDPFVTYDFHFLTIYYCDLEKAPEHRSMHQINGKRFPLELHFVFMKNHDGNIGWFERDNGVPLLIPKTEDGGDPNRHSMYQYINGKNIMVIVVVQGELGEEDNKYFEPVVEAASNFYGKDFGEDSLDDTNNVMIKGPWSPSWLLPDASSYYYYNDASFPVPPCWKVSRYYVMNERISISQRQLDVLTNIKTDRESNSDHVLACTYSILQHEILTGEVTLNLLEYVFSGNDEKPRTLEEQREWETRKKKMETFRKRLKGMAVGTIEEGISNTGPTPTDSTHRARITLNIFIPLTVLKNWSKDI